jgi:uncharacterized protein (UPF0332 family)
MTSKELDNLVRTNLLKSEPAKQSEIDGLYQAGYIRLTDAKKPQNSIESRFDLAYNAAHSLSLAALRLRGYRPSKVRYIVFQTLPHTLNMDAATWRVLDKAHRLRNSAEYEGYFEVNEQILTDLIKSTEAVLDALKKNIAK